MLKGQVHQCCAIEHIIYFVHLQIPLTSSYSATTTCGSNGTREDSCLKSRGSEARSREVFEIEMDAEARTNLKVVLQLRGTRGVKSATYGTPPSLLRWALKAAVNTEICP